MRKSILALVLTSLAAPCLWAQATLPPVQVFGPTVCLACIDWTEHLRRNGFVANFEGVEDIAAVKRRLGVPPELESVPTAAVGPYFIEGHVPAQDVKNLLAERPKARGLAVPGLPMGAPGYESSPTDDSCETGCTILESGSAERPARREAFDTLLVAPDGRTSVFARH